ncbi:MAG: hypothetical protein KF722_07740 [Nitrospira sp.]|nr:hypothetical protein [Nitrospira sp.]
MSPMLLFVFMAFLTGGASFMPGSVQAAPIINLGGETYSVGTLLPDPDPFCTTSCGYPSVSRGKAAQKSNCDPGVSAPTGNICFRWDVPASTLAIGNQIQCSGMCRVDTSEGDVIYLAFQMNFQNPNGDIWRDGPGANSADKGVGLHSPGSSGGFRWDLSMGCWDSLTQCLDHHFTLWIGNPSYHHNVGGVCGEVNDIYHPNVPPYVGGTVPQLAYNRWHNIIMGITMSSGSTGRAEAWVNGQKFLDCRNIKTMNTSNNDFGYIEFGGTIAQPAYNAPAHIRYFDNLIVTKSWSDISTFLVDPESGSSTVPPGPPSNLRVQ